MLMLAAAQREGVGPVSIETLAQRQELPRKFLEAILVDLKRNGFVASTRGPRGGYVLTREPSEITFGEVIRSIEGPLALIGCASQKFYRPCRDCPDEAACALRRVMMEAREQLASVLDNRTLADAASEGFCVVPELSQAS